MDELVGPRMDDFISAASISRRTFGSGVFVCWAKVGKAKLIANPARASSKRIFMVSLVLSPMTLLRDFSESPEERANAFGQRS